MNSNRKIEQIKVCLDKLSLQEIIFYQKALGSSKLVKDFVNVYIKKRGKLC